MQREVAGLMFVLVFLFTFVYVGSGVATLSHEFGGSKDFNNTNEAYSYQKMIISEAKSANASVDWVDISVNKDSIYLSWQVFMQGDWFASEPFKYGERKFPPVTMIVTWILMLLFEIGGFIWVLLSWHKDDKKPTNIIAYNVCKICGTLLVSPNNEIPSCPNNNCSQYKQLNSL